jgi:hypothetical protein
MSLIVIGLAILGIVILIGIIFAIIEDPSILIVSLIVGVVFGFISAGISSALDFSIDTFLVFCIAFGITFFISLIIGASGISFSTRVGKDTWMHWK